MVWEARHGFTVCNFVLPYQTMYKWMFICLWREDILIQECSPIFGIGQVAWVQSKPGVAIDVPWMVKYDVQLSLGNIARKVSENQWLPLKVDEDRQKREGSATQNNFNGQRHQRQVEFTMKLLVRKTLVNASKARAGEEFAVSLARLQNLGIDIRDKNASRR